MSIFVWYYMCFPFGNKHLHLGGYKRLSVAASGEARSTFGHANANFSVFIDRIKDQFSKKYVMIMI